jgi:hypothetical protein
MMAVSMPFAALAAPGDYEPDVRLSFSPVYIGGYFDYDESTTSYFDSSMLQEAPLTYDYTYDKATATVSGTLKLESSKAKYYALYYKDPDEADEDVEIPADQTLTTGDYFAVTIRMDNVSTLFASQQHISYSDNIEPAGLYSYTTGSGKNKVTHYGLAGYSDDKYSSVSVGGTTPVASMSADELYTDINDGVLGNLSSFDVENRIIQSSVLDENGDTSTMDVSTLKSDPENGYVFSNPETGEMGYDYINQFVCNTYIFKITDGSKPISFGVYDTDNTKVQAWGGMYYIADKAEVNVKNYTTYAINGSNPGSTKMTFYGKNVNVASTGYTISYTTNDSDLGSVTIDGVETKNGANYGDYDPNSVVKLVATPATEGGFVGWYVDGKLVSTDLEYDLTVVSNTSVKAVFNSPKDDDITVVFLDKYNNVLSTFTGAASEVADNAPTVPAVGVYTFKEWDTDLTAITTSTTVKATYTKSADATYTVETAAGVEINGDSTSATATFAYDTKVTLYKEGASYWYIGDEADPTIVAYGDTYDFYVGGDITVKPSTATVVAANASAAIVSTILNTETGKARFLATTTLATDDSVVLIEHGFIYGRDMADTDLTLEKVDTKVGSYTVKKSVANPGSSEFALNYKCTPASGSTATGKAVAYVVYSVNGVVQDTLYSNVGSYEFK